jgi:hypothetical protein
MQPVGVRESPPLVFGVTAWNRSTTPPSGVARSMVLLPDSIRLASRTGECPRPATRFPRRCPLLDRRVIRRRAAAAPV